MTFLYLDSNAFAKLYLDEDMVQQAQIITLLEQFGRVAANAITYAEVSSVFARYFHEGKLDEAQYADRMRRFSEDWETVNVLETVPEILVRAAQLMKAHKGLRAMDALHLASALALRQSVGLKFLSFDTRLQDAAQKLMPEANL